MSAMRTTVSLSTLLFFYIVSSKDYSDCKWFGNTTNAPFYPIDVCNAHSHETELNGLTLYSTKMECSSNDVVTQYEWDNIDCTGEPYNTQTYRKENGYYFNCDAETSCPFTKIILRELAEFGPVNNSDHNDHICAYDKQKYHEISIVTNICIDLMEQFNLSFYIDCSTHHVTYQEFEDGNCKTKIPGNNNFTITEGCDDPFDLNAYVQISECDEANYNQPNSPMPTVTRLTTMPSETPAVRTPSPTIQTTFKQTRSPIINGGGKKSNTSSSKDSPYIIVVVLLCVIILVLILLVFYIISRQKKLKAEVLLNESVNVTQ